MLEAGKRTLGEILNPNRIIEVPFFQRSYVWNEDQWERFVHDIDRTILGEEKHFMGPLILKQRKTSSNTTPGDRRILIDGQQRLTTLIILYRCLAEKFNKEQEDVGEQLKKMMFYNTTERTVIMKHNHNDISAFNAIIQNDLGEKLINNNNTYDSSQVFKCYEYLHDVVDKKIEWSYAKCLKLSYSVFFVGVDLSQEENEQQIFDTLNSIGVPLTHAELVKNMLFTEDGKTLYVNKWRPTFELDNMNFWIRIVGAQNYKRYNLDLFLYSYLLIFLRRNKLKMTIEEFKTVKQAIVDKDMYRADILSHNYSKLIGIDLIKPDNETFLNDVISCAKIYQEKIAIERFDTPIVGDNSFVDEINTAVLGFPVVALVPYLLFIYSEVDQKEQKSMVDLLVNYLVRRMACGAPATDYGGASGFATFITDNINTYDKLIKELDGFSDTNNYFPSDELFSSGLKKQRLPNNRARVILYLLELALRGKKDSTILTEYSKYQLEHIMPKKWEQHWSLPVSDNPAENRIRHIDRTGAVQKIGNLTLLSSALNNAIKNTSWKDKKAGNAKGGGLVEYSSGMKIFNNKFLNLSEWNEAEIDKRGEFLAKKALEAWPYPQFPEDDDNKSS